MKLCYYLMAVGVALSVDVSGAKSDTTMMMSPAQNEMSASNVSSKEDTSSAKTTLPKVTQQQQDRINKLLQASRDQKKKRDDQLNQSKDRNKNDIVVNYTGTHAGQKTVDGKNVEDLSIPVATVTCNNVSIQIPSDTKTATFQKGSIPVLNNGYCELDENGKIKIDPATHKCVMQSGLSMACNLFNSWSWRFYIWKFERKFRQDYHWTNDKRHITSF